MKLERITVAVSILLIVAGGVLVAWGPALMPWFGVPPLPEPDSTNAEAIGWWRLVSFARLSGVGVLGIGALMFSVRKAIPVIGERRFAATVGLTTALVGLVVATQQIALWGTRAGRLTAVTFVLIALTYGYFAARGSEATA